MDKVYAGGVPVAEVIRSGFVEGRHHGSVVVLDGTGAVVDAAGDVTAPVFPRSSNKPLQAVGMLRIGLRLADAADLAVVCASHWGEEHHLARVRAMLRSAGLEESALRCPPALPLDDAARAAVLAAGGGPSRIQMNCSGKHAGMLLTCLAAGRSMTTTIPSIRCSSGYGRRWRPAPASRWRRSGWTAAARRCSRFR
jgi:L-asparaginase II